MTLLRAHAQRSPDKAAAKIAETGETLDYRTLDARSARLAMHLVERQLPAGAVIATLIGNSLRYFEVCWAARRAGLYYVPISTHLTAGEVQHILENSGAQVLFVGAICLPLLKELPSKLRQRLAVIVVDGPPLCDTDPEYTSIVDADTPAPPLPERPLGLDFAYSSGTTGRPKGVKHALVGDAQLNRALAGDWLAFFRFGPDTVYLSPAPLYHAAPLRFCIRCIAAGGTAIVMRRFDAQCCLEAIEHHGVTHSQWVPTMLVRMLMLPDAVRRQYDLSSHSFALHSAAPCPVEIKRRMIEWWGTIIWEYYSGSERVGATVISTPEWLAHPGSVGRAVQGTLHIVDEQCKECPIGVDGLVCFEGGPRFQYYNDPVKTAQAYTPQGWATFGDIGHVDAEGYLYLTDRRANMIISGGVNIYPQEAENLLLAHPLVAEVAVIGIPHAEFGEEVKAVVELRDPTKANDDTAQLLIDYCRERLSHVKCPRSVDFATSLPRTETGKLLKRLVRDQYRERAGKAASAIR